MKKLQLPSSILSAFLSWRIITLLLLISASIYTPVHPNHVQFTYENIQSSLTKVFQSGDASWYLQIAKDGYAERTFSNQKQENWAFFPLFPILIKGVAFVTGGNYILAGALIANIALLGSLYVLYLLSLSLGKNQESALRGVWLVLAFPTSYLVGLPFTEGIFLLLTTLTFYLALKNKWGWASTLIGLVLITRPTGLLLLPAFFWQFFSTHAYRNKLNLLSLLIIPIGLILFAYHLNALTGNPLAFIDIQKNWGRNNDLIGFLDYSVKNINLLASCWNFIWLNWLACFGSISIAIWFFVKKEYVWVIYLIVPISVSLATGNIISLARIAFSLFPIYIALAEICKKPERFYFLLALSSGLLFVLTLLCGLTITFAMT